MELGSPVWDEDDKVWTIGLDNKGKVLGFVAHVCKNMQLTFCSDFVVPESRRKGIYSMLMQERLKLIPAYYRIKATATDMSLHEYLKQGFEKKGVRGRFHVVELLPRHSVT